MKRKKNEVSPNNNDRWLLTYADMITLLMAFFIMMYSMSVLNLNKFHAAAVSIRSGFGGMIRGQGGVRPGSVVTFVGKPSPISKGEMTGGAWQTIKPLVSFIESDPQLRKSTIVGQDQRGIVISVLSDNLLFDPASADVKDKARPLLDSIAEMLDKTTNRVRVEGYTCDLPPRNTRAFPTNWELSTARAVNVLRYFTELKGLDAERFSVAGYAGLRPVVPNTSEQNRRKNRRVDIVIVTNEPPLQPKTAEAGSNNDANKRIVPWPVDRNHRTPMPVISKPTPAVDVP